MFERVSRDPDCVTYGTATPTSLHLLSARSGNMSGCVHYKFKSSLDYDTATFDGIHISLGDLKKAIILHKKLGTNKDLEIQITNAQTKEGE